MVLGGSMDHIGTVDHHVSGFIISNQPVALKTISHFHKVGADPAALAHVAVIRIDALFRRKISVFHAKLGLHLASHGVCMLQVEQASHFDGNITKRYPTGTESVSPCAQIDQIVVSTCAVIFARMGEANNFALMQVGFSL